MLQKSWRHYLTSKCWTDFVLPVHSGVDQWCRNYDVTTLRVKNKWQSQFCPPSWNLLTDLSQTLTGYAWCYSEQLKATSISLTIFPGPHTQTHTTYNIYKYIMQYNNNNSNNNVGQWFSYSKNNIFLTFILISFNFMTIMHSLHQLWNLLLSARVSYNLGQHFAS